MEPGPYKFGKTESLFRPLDPPEEDIARLQPWLDKRASWTPKDCEHHLKSDVHSAHLIACKFFFLDRLDECASWAATTLDLADDFFFGDWREKAPSGPRGDLPPDRSFHDRITSWTSSFEACLLWASALGQWERLRHFAEYLRDDVVLDFDQSSENRAWLLLVAGVLRGRPQPETQPFSQTIIEGKRKREKLLFNILSWIEEGDVDRASEALAEYATHYRMVEVKKMEWTAKLALDATFLVHWAEFSDVPIEVPTKLEPHIVRLSAANAST